jgi:cytosine/adenosine deaminase-related metal-dependent hydrolase
MSGTSIKYHLSEDGRLNTDTNLSIVRAAEQLIERERANGYDCVVFPGFVNAHTHIQFSLYKKTTHIKKNQSFLEWLEEVVKFCRTTDDSFWKYSYLYGLEQIRRSEASLVLDVVSTHTLPSLLTLFSNTNYRKLIVSYLELAGVQASQEATTITNYKKTIEKLTDREIWLGVSPHAIYSISKELYLWMIKFSQRASLPLQSHVSESKEELQYLKSKGRLEEIFGRKDFTQNFSLERFLCETIGAHSTNTLGIYNTVAHTVHTTKEDIFAMVAHGILPVICMRSNQYLKVGRVDIEFLIESSTPFLIGTDSLASSPSLNIIDEASELIKEVESSLKLRETIDETYFSIFRALTSNLYRQNRTHNKKLERYGIYRLPNTIERPDSSVSLLRLLFARKLIHIGTVIENELLT